MQLSDFDFDLPDELIARHPPTSRRSSRLLVVADGLNDAGFSDFESYLRPGDLLVFNDTRVIPARLRGAKQSGGKIEVLIERLQGESDALAQVKASKSPGPGTKLDFGNGVSAEVIGRDGSLFQLRFSEPVDAVLSRIGEVPLPPYLERLPEDDDLDRYQTVYARHAGAVAAPTAGLHFDDQMLADTKAAGVRHAFVTLHVGAGTFQPLREEQLAANSLHSERVTVDSDVCTAVCETRDHGGRVIAVGTTSVRALESASRSGEIEPFSGETDLFIQPGFKFNSVDAMCTNFHLPQSSLLVLVSAFAGRERVLFAYQHAIMQRYRFYSYGDAMLLFPPSA